MTMETIEEMKGQNDAAVVIANQYGVITFVNPRFSEIFGWGPNEIVGKPLSTIIPTNLHDAHNLGFSRFLTTEQPRLLQKPLRLKAVKKDGVIFDAEHFIVANKKNDEWIFGATIRPL